jgi:hypothetical protein
MNSRYAKISDDCILNTETGQFIEVPKIINFGADSNIIDDDNPVTLSWEVSGNIGLVQLNGEIVSRRGLKEHWAESDQNFVLEIWIEDLLITSAELLIAVMAEPPEILFFQSPKDYGIKGFPVELNWHVKNAKNVVITGLGEVQLVGTRYFTVQQNACFELTAFGSFGKIEKSNLNLILVEPPTIETISVPIPKVENSLNYHFKSLSLPQINFIHKQPSTPNYKEIFGNDFGKLYKTTQQFKWPNFESLKELFTKKTRQ